MPKSTSLPSRLTPTSEIVAGARYSAAPAAFFGQFSEAWAGVCSQVLKLETRQKYEEPEDPSLARFLAGDVDGAIRLLAESVRGDKELYAEVRRRRIDFVRCRPVAFPLTPYLRWEMLHYELNATEGERIFCCGLADNHEVFDRCAKHDFMVFDDSVAFIHDYDETGTIRGGWRTEDPDAISELQRLHCWIRSRSRPYEEFRETTGG